MTGDPEIYWRIDMDWFQNNLPEETKPEFVDAPTKNDPCHYEIMGFPKNGTASKNVMKEAWENNPNSFFQCEGLCSIAMDREALTGASKLG